MIVDVIEKGEKLPHIRECHGMEMSLVSRINTQQSGWQKERKQTICEMMHLQHEHFN